MLVSPSFRNEVRSGLNIGLFPMVDLTESVVNKKTYRCYAASVCHNPAIVALATPLAWPAPLEQIGHRPEARVLARNLTALPFLRQLRWQVGSFALISEIAISPYGPTPQAAASMDGAAIASRS
jgi:hypothetical protein